MKKVLIVNFEHISHFFLVFWLLTLNKLMLFAITLFLFDAYILCHLSTIDKIHKGFQQLIACWINLTFWIVSYIIDLKLPYLSLQIFFLQAWTLELESLRSLLCPPLMNWLHCISKLLDSHRTVKRFKIIFKHYEASPEYAWTYWSQIQ